MATITEAQQTRVAPREKAFNPFGDWVGLVPFGLFILLFMFIPLTNLFAGAFQDDKGHFTLNNIVALSDPYVLKSFTVSLQVAAITAVAGGIFGFLVAYAITIGKAPGWMRNILMTFSGLAVNFGGVPLAFAFIATLGHTGFVTAILRNICFAGPNGTQNCPFDIYQAGFTLYSVLGLSLAYIYFEFPLMVLTIIPALESLRNEWREASDNMGGTVLDYWRYVAFPMLLPSIIGSSILLFAASYGAFATAEALTGGSISLVTILIDQQINGDVLNNPNEGYALALGVVVVVGIYIVAALILQRRASQWAKR